MSIPLDARRTVDGVRLIGLGMHILRQRCTALVRQTGGRLALEQGKTRLDVVVAGVEISCTGVRIEGVTRLIVARLVLQILSEPCPHQDVREKKTYQSAEIIPHLRDVGIQADSARVGVEGITVLVDLIVQHTNGTPEGRVSTVTVDCLLVGLIRLGVLLLRHVASTEQVPALCIRLV